VYPVPLNTDRKLEASAEKRVEVLKMSATALWLSVSILGFLILVTGAIMALYKSHLRPLQRNVECLADIMALIIKSERFMKLVEEKGVDRLKEEDTLLTRLGWFVASDGEKRWGIEVAGAEVQWLDEAMSG